jgi:hypothetical protein
MLQELMDKELLEKILKRAVNMVSGLKANSNEEKLKALGLTRRT